MTTPNLYDFATSELSQDATLAYLLSWARPEHRDRNLALNRLGESLLRALVGASAAAQGIDDPLRGRPIEKVSVVTQESHVDISVRVNDAVWLIIEDKTSTCEHSDQINRYVQVAHRDPRPDGRPWQVMPIYVKTGNECRPPRGLPYGLFLREDLLTVLEEVAETDNTIVREFRDHLLRWQESTESFRHAPCAQWTQEWTAKEGYYMALEAWLDQQPGRRNGLNDPGWGYVANQSGGFLGFWWHWRTFEPCACPLYLQIQDATRLQVRAGNADSGSGGPARVDSALLWQVYRAFAAAARQERFCQIRMQKAGRFRGGQGAGVVDLSFDDEGHRYLAVSDGGHLDLPATQSRLLLAMGLVDAVSIESQEGRRS